MTALPKLHPSQIKFLRTWGELEKEIDRLGLPGLKDSLERVGREGPRDHRPDEDQRIRDLLEIQRVLFEKGWLLSPELVDQMQWGREGKPPD